MRRRGGATACGARLRAAERRGRERSREPAGRESDATCRPGRGTAGLEVAAPLLALLPLLGSCHRAPRPVLPASGGPLVRVELLEAPVLEIAFAGRVEVVSLSEDRVLFSGPVPWPCAARRPAGGVALAGRVFPGAVGLRPSPWGASAGGGTGPPGGNPLNLAVGLAETVAGEEAGGRAPRGVAWPRLEPGTFAIRAAGAPRCYRGRLELHPSGRGLRAVNVLGLEEYLGGVVGAEMPALWPEAALRAQAVASRTYALYALEEARQGGRERCLPAGTSFQVYGGLASEHPRTLEAVRATRGEVLLFQGRLFRAYFHSICGGQTAAAGLTFGEPPIPPLAGVACSSCLRSPHARWESVLGREELLRSLEACRRRPGAPRGIGAPVDLEIAEVGVDGRVLYLRVLDARGSFEWRADRFREAVERVAPGTLRSTAFHVERRSGGLQYHFQGTGWGHGAGLCQTGSRGLAATRSYREILGFYYPGSEPVRVYR